MNDPTPAATTRRVPIGPYDQLIVTHPALEHDSTPASRYTLIELADRLGPSSVLLLELFNAGRCSRHEHTTGFDAGEVARQLGLNTSRFDLTVQRLARFGYLIVGAVEVRNGQQLVDIRLDPSGAR